VAGAGRRRALSKTALGERRCAAREARERGSAAPWHRHRGVIAVCAAKLTAAGGLARSLLGARHEVCGD
jgi:hypothetical protein